jgi:tetratricopeptide (TPR) repeat protein
MHTNFVREDPLPGTGAFPPVRKPDRATLIALTLLSVQIEGSFRRFRTLVAAVLIAAAATLAALVIIGGITADDWIAEHGMPALIDYLRAAWQSLVSWRNSAPGAGQAVLFPLFFTEIRSRAVALDLRHRLFVEKAWLRHRMRRLFVPLGWWQRLLIAGAGALIVYTVATSPPVVIESISVPSNLSAIGYTPDVFREEVMGKLGSLKKDAVALNAMSSRTGGNLSIDLPQELPNFDIPGSPFAFPTVVRGLQTLLGREPMRIQVEVTHQTQRFILGDDPHEFRVTWRVANGNGGWTSGPYDVIANDPSELVVQVVSGIIHQIDTVMYVYYLTATGGDEVARKALGQMIADGEDLKWAYYIRATFSYTWGESENAIRDIEISIGIDKKFAPAYYLYGHVLRRAKRFDEARTAFEKVVQLNPRIGFAHRSLGDVLSAKGLREEAVTQYRIAVKLNPSDFGAWESWGEALKALGRLDEAAEKLQKAEQIQKSRRGKRQTRSR